jgi:hypothetical protein
MQNEVQDLNIEVFTSNTKYLHRQPTSDAQEGGYSSFNEDNFHQLHVTSNRNRPTSRNNKNISVG